MTEGVKVERQGITWIPVSDRLPAPGERVLVACRNQKGIQNVNIGYFTSDGVFHGMGSSARATHWMMLPEVPRNE